MHPHAVWPVACRLLRQPSRMRHLLLAACLLGAPALAQTLTPGPVANTFQLNNFVTGLNSLTDFRFLPDGRVVMTEKGGTAKVRLTDGTVVVAGTFSNVDSSSEKGLLGVELHPSFATNGRLFFYVSDGPSDIDKHRILSIVLNPDSTLQCGGGPCSPDGGTSQVLLANLKGPANHDGSGMGIGPDGKLYVGVGDTGCNSGVPPGGTITNFTGSCLTTANGKILRINVDGTIPSDNPLVGTLVHACNPTSNTCGDDPRNDPVTGQPRTEIWSWGVRNPFRFSFDPMTGRLWVGDVGEVTYEEVNLVTKGQHYGWPFREGAFGYPLNTCDTLGANGGGSDCVDPSYFCVHGGTGTQPDGGVLDGNCQSITGGTFLDTPGWPAAFQSRYWFGDNANGNVWTLTPNAARDGWIPSPRTSIGTGFGTVIRFLVGPDGLLYIGSNEGVIRVLSPKAGLPDAGPPDGGSPDAGPPDAGPPDAGPRDAGTPLDAGPIDFDGGTQPGGLAGGTPFQGPENCRSCHSSAAVDAGILYMPYDTWVSTMMGNAIRDPLFQAALTVANQDLAGIGQWCLRCHSPPSFVDGHAASGGIAPLDDIDRAGISCEVCHRTVPSAELVGNARITFEQSLTMHGPYDGGSPSHLTLEDPAIGQSSLCGQCHQVFNPLIHRAGTTRPFPLDTTFSEWLQSAYSTGPGARTCQSCHMEVQQGDLVVAKDTSVTRTNPLKHTFAGDNIWGLAAVQAADPTRAEFAADFAATSAAALRSLQSAARVEIVPPSGPVPAGSEVELKVRVTNLTGHKLPTGYGDGRRVFIELSIGDQVVSGRYDTTAGDLVPDVQLAVFEAVHGRADGGLDHLALHDTIFKDTRIEPLGFQPDADTEPVGISFLKDADGGALGAAEWTYRVTFPAELAGDAGVVTAKLFHQVTTRDYVEALAQANATDSTGTQLLSIWNTTGQAPPVEMTRATQSIPLVSIGDSAVTGSCGCHATSGSAAALPALGVLVVLVLRRRRTG